jgi:hypothetical protein
MESHFVRSVVKVTTAAAMDTLPERLSVRKTAVAAGISSRRRSPTTCLRRPGRNIAALARLAPRFTRLRWHESRSLEPDISSRPSGDQSTDTGRTETSRPVALVDAAGSVRRLCVNNLMLRDVPGRRRGKKHLGQPQQQYLPDESRRGCVRVREKPRAEQIELFLFAVEIYKMPP